MTKKEIIEECKQRLGFETDYEMYSLCQHEKDFYNAIIEALEQQPSDDEITITINKGTLKYSGQGYVVYNKDWFKKHFATEVEIMTGYDGYIEQTTFDDCVSRQAVVEYIKASDAELGHDSENELVVEDILNMPPITPTHGTCKDCKWWDSENNIIGYCNACRHGHCSSSWDIGIYRKTKADFYCADFEKRGNEDGI